LIPVLGGSPPVYRHQGTANTAWVDGHVTAERPEKLEAVANTEGGKPTRDGIDRYLYWNLR
jgi:prepilin-type processing-associated H-X9-DG protein